MKGDDRKPSGTEKLMAQWPGLAGLALLVIAGGYYWYAKTYPPHIIYPRLLIGLIVGAIVLLGYWSLANRDSNY